MKGIERVKGAQSKPNPSPNAFPKIMLVVLRPNPTKREGDAHGSLCERKILVKSPETLNKEQRKVEKLLQKLLAEIITEYYYRKL